MSKRKVGGQPKIWTEDQLKLLVKNFKSLTYKELKSYLGMCFPTIKAKATELGLSRDNVWVLSYLLREKLFSI